MIDIGGKLAVPAEYAGVEPPSEGRILFKSHEKKDSYGFLDLDGNVVLKPQYRLATGFRCGLAYVSYSSDGEDVGFFVDHAGRHRIGPITSDPNFGSEFNSFGFAVTVNPSTHRKNVIDTSGAVLLEERPDVTIRRVCGEWIVAVDEATGNFGIMDLKGRWAIKPVYEDVWIDSNGYALVTLPVKPEGRNLANPPEPQQGLIRTDGTTVLAPGRWDFGLLRIACNRLSVALRTENKAYMWGCVSLPSGNITIKPSLASLSVFSEGFAVFTEH